MDAQQQALQYEMTKFRSQHRKLDTWLNLRCANGRCSVEEVNIYLHETDNTLPAQAPMLCPRCRQGLIFQGFSKD
jgi:hypothetical protein